jgi:hypothetical protein
LAPVSDKQPKLVIGRENFNFKIQRANTVQLRLQMQTAYGLEVQGVLEVECSFSRYHIPQKK